MGEFTGTGRRRASRLDRDVAALLAARALVEIRHLARRERSGAGDGTEEALEHIAFLADLAHNLPGVARPRRYAPSRPGASPRSRERAMDARPMSWVWNTAGPRGRAWILRCLEEEGRNWTPPPPLPEYRRGPSPMTPRQRVGLLLGRWPVRTPPGCRPLPAAANVLKVLDTEAVCALHDEVRRLRLGLGGGGPWLRAHLDPDGVHYLLPDPASYYWPGTPVGRGGISWWQCTGLLRMRDGEQVGGMVAVLPETFAALPSTLPRRQQLRLAHRVRSTERDVYLWGRDHRAECAPESCGYVPEEPEEPEELEESEAPEEPEAAGGAPEAT
ncbi:hypothetical protein [Kitasatospora sp. NPDC057198]|uniref:hypothetical protein n=1 Tax=Kitasatospora sp. NPDC057198 TaxID=3346046 RepID=UPI0036393B8E